jgi:hypothetical protein
LFCVPKQISNDLPAPTAGPNLFVLDEGVNLDTGLQDYNRTITLPVGTVNPAATGAFLYIYAFDLDVPSEQDRITWNGVTVLGLLEGADDTL